MKSVIPSPHHLAFCLAVGAIIAVNGSRIASAQESSEVLAELRRTNERLESLERRIDLIERLLTGGGGVALSEASKSAAVVPAGTSAMAITTAARPVPVLPTERGVRTEFHRIADLNHADYALPETDPDAVRVAASGDFTPDKVRELVGYSEEVTGIVIWEGLAQLPAGRYEFHFGWTADAYRRQGGSTTQRRPSRISATVSSEADGQSFTLDHDRSIADPKMLTVELAEGIYRFRLAAPTDVKKPDPVYYKQYQTNSVSIRYRMAENGVGWTDLSPSMLFAPKSLQP